MQSACPKARDWLTKMNMWPQPQLAQDPAEWLGDAHPLVAQLGSADGLASLDALAESLRARPVASLPALRTFLRCYHEHVLLPHELPSIQTAFGHASRHEIGVSGQPPANPRFVNS